MLTIGYLWKEYEKFWFFIMCHDWRYFSGNSLLNSLMQLVSFSSFLLTFRTFLVFSTGRLWITFGCSLPCLQELSTFHNWSKLSWITYAITSGEIKIGVWTNSAGRLIRVSGLYSIDSAHVKYGVWVGPQLT